MPGRHLAAILLLLAAAPGRPDEPDRFPSAGAAYLVAVDGRPLWARAPDEPRPPASLTKLMAALVLLEPGWEPEVWVKVSARAERETGSRLGLRAGEEIGAGEALLATLVASANDACLALAEAAAGSAEAFAARMNRRASEMGLLATHFENPCGHDAPGQRSSARDLWRIAQAALASPELRRMVAAERGRATTRRGRTLEFTTGNALLGRLAGARGVKRGFTPGAGKCVVALAERGGVEVLLVLLGAPDRWWTAAGIVEAAFREAERGG